MTQHQRILQYIDDFGSITPMEAFQDLGITKLATRVSELIRDGERIAQLVVMPYLAVSFFETEELDKTGRGEGGFGHTGKN